MCAINPRHQAHFILSVYTSRPMTKNDFLSLVEEKALDAEMKLNEDMRLRWHLVTKEEAEDHAQRS